MKVCVLNSGSKGNCTYIETEKSKILIDCGLSKKTIVAGLENIGVKPTEINGIFITHEHSDHIKGLGAFSRAFNTPIFVHNSIAQEVKNKIGEISAKNLIDFWLNDFYFQDITISPFAVPHDSINCVGFSLYSAGEKISLSTDLGDLSDETLKKMAGSKTIILESNHDEKMLRANTNYPTELKKRILSSHGHLSNDACAKAIYELCKLGTNDFILAHLSQDNNTPSLALAVSTSPLLNEKLVLGKDFNIEVASQDISTKIHQ